MYEVFVPVELGDQKTFWNRVGSAFVNSKGLTLLLDAIPAGGKVVVIAEELALEDKPYRVFTPVEYGEGKTRRTRWTRIGTALSNKRGLSVFFNAYPVNGKAVVITVEDAHPGDDPQTADPQAEDSLAF